MTRSLGSRSVRRLPAEPNAGSLSGRPRRGPSTWQSHGRGTVRGNALVVGGRHAHGVGALV
jgi:hypothetical protein